MSDKVKAYDRTKQIVRLLYENGPLPTRGIVTLIEPPIRTRNARAAVQTLKKRGLVIPRFIGIPKNWSNWYQLSLREENKPKLAEILNVNPAALKTPMIREQELVHSYECAKWCKWFRLMFPDAKIERETTYRHDPFFMNPLLVNYDQYHLLPDILMRIPSKAEKDTVTIAIEIERTRKSLDRVAEKLKKFAMEARIDGAIYICQTEAIKETYRQLYENKQRKNSPRINSYGDNFFLFTNGQFSTIEGGPIMFNSELKPVSIFDWVKFLVENSGWRRIEASRKLTPMSAADHVDNW